MATIVTGEVRFSYVNVFMPRANEDGGEAKYSVTLLIPKTDATTFQAFQNGIQQALQEGVSSTFGGQMPARPAIPFYDGDGVRPNGEPFNEEAKGHWVITASSKQKPEVVDSNVQPILNQSEFYSGCYGRASVRFYPYNKAGKKGIGCGLGNVQKLRDGQPLAGGTTASEDFGAALSATFPVPVQQMPPQPMQAQFQVPGAPQYQQPVAQAPQPQINPLTGFPYAQAPTGGVMGI